MDEHQAGFRYPSVSSWYMLHDFQLDPLIPVNPIATWVVRSMQPPSRFTWSYDNNSVTQFSYHMFCSVTDDASYLIDSHTFDSYVRRPMRRRFFRQQKPHHLAGVCRMPPFPLCLPTRLRQDAQSD